MSSVARRYFLRGQRSLAHGDIEGAVDSFRSALDLAPSFVSARVCCAVALTRAGDCPRAAQVLRAGLAGWATPVGRAALWATLGDVLTTSGDLLGAEDALKQAAEEPSFTVRAASGLARVYGKLGRYDEAMAQLRAAASRSAAATDTAANE